MNARLFGATPFPAGPPLKPRVSSLGLPPLARHAHTARRRLRQGPQCGSCQLGSRREERQSARTAKGTDRHCRPWLTPTVRRGSPKAYGPAQLQQGAGMAGPSPKGEPSRYRPAARLLRIGNIHRPGYTRGQPAGGWAHTPKRSIAKSAQAGQAGRGWQVMATGKKGKFGRGAPDGLQHVKAGGEAGWRYRCLSRLILTDLAPYFSSTRHARKT